MINLRIISCLFLLAPFSCFADSVNINATIDPTIFQEAYIKSADGTDFDGFGGGLAMSGNTLVVSVVFDDSASVGVNNSTADDFVNFQNSGAVYVFVRENEEWTQQAYLKASNTQSDDLFGYDVAISGDTIVVGAINEGSGSVGVNNDEDNDDEIFSGAAYVFTRTGTTWSQQAYLKASNTDFGDNFGTSVAINGDTIAIGATYEDSNSANEDNQLSINSGAVYVFNRIDGNWSQSQFIKASTINESNSFGSSVALDGDILVVGANRENSASTGVNNDEINEGANDSGAAYVFVNNAGVWQQQAYLKASNTSEDDYFGRFVSINQDTIVVSAYFEDSDAIGVNGDGSNELAEDSGAVYVFARDGVNWSQQAFLKASNTESGDRFGVSVDIEDDTILIGAELEDGGTTGVDGDDDDNAGFKSGASYVFSRTGSSWRQTNYLKASNTDILDHYGNAAAISGNILVVGSVGESSMATGINGDQADNSRADSGAVYVFNIDTVFASGFE